MKNKIGGTLPDQVYQSFCKSFDKGAILSTNSRVELEICMTVLVVL